MLKFVREHLSVKMSLRLIAVAIPLLSIAVWRASLDAAADEREAATELLVDRGRVAAVAGAAAYSSILESGIDAKEFTLEDLLHPDYSEISFVGVPPCPKGAAGMTPAPRCVEHKRYHTKYDGYTDSHGIQRIEDAILASSPDLIYASGIDVHGYVPTPHHKYDQTPTGDLLRDRKVSRGKRKYEDPEQLSAAGYMGSDPLVMDYHRDTGELIWDVVAPIDVKGHHWGAFRVGVVRDQVDIRASTLAASLAVDLARVLAVALLLLAITIFWSASVAMRPLRELACTATLLSTTHDGSGLQTPIRATSSDEIGQMAKALDRLRQSLRIAFQRE